MRDRSSGRGYLWPDCFAEDRLVLVPPASTALLVIFSRNHNVSRGSFFSIMLGDADSFAESG